MTTVLRIIAAVMLAAATSACVFPVSRDRAPEISGVLLKGGVPVENAQIELVASSPLKDASSQPAETPRRAVTRTDANGRFKVGPLRGVKMVHLIGDEMLQVHLAIRVGHEDFVGLSDSGTGYSATWDVVCDLSKPKKVGNLVTYCR